MRYLLLLPLLAACGMNEYRPQLAAQPKDQAKFESDLKDCIQYSKDVRSKPNVPNSVIVSTFGLVGFAALEASKQKDDPYFKNGPELTDECLISRGYAVAE